MIQAAKERAPCDPRAMCRGLSPTRVAVSESSELGKFHRESSPETCLWRTLAKLFGKTRDVCPSSLDSGYVPGALTGQGDDAFLPLSGKMEWKKVGAFSIQDGSKLVVVVVVASQAVVVIVLVVPVAMVAVLDSLRGGP